MKEAIATSRCEVAGKVYLPGDKMFITKEQMAFLKTNNAAQEVVSQEVSGGVLTPGVTIPEAESLYRRLVGADKPKKEKRR